MKKLMKKILCLVLAAALSLSLGLVTFAGETDSDVSLDDLLALLQQLADSTEDEGGGEEADPGIATIGGVSFAIPEGLVDASESGTSNDLMYMAEDLSSYLSASYFEAMEGEDINLSDETNLQMLIESMASEGNEVLGYEAAELDGHNAVLIAMGPPADSEATEGYTSYSLVIQVDNGLVPIQYITNREDGAEVFQTVLDSVTIGDAPATTPAGGPVSTGTPAPASATEIDATLVDEVVLVDNDVCKVAMKKFSTEDDYYAFTCKMYLENKSDLNLYFSTDYESVNDYMCSCYFGESVAAGHKTNADFHIYESDLEANNITDIRSISFELTVSDDDDWSADDLVCETFTILPFGADVPVQPEQTFDADAITLIDTDGIKMILKGFDDTDSYYFIANVYIENDTDKNLRFGLDSASAINGYEIYPYLYEYIPSGKKANTQIHWYWDDLEENDIDTLEDMELILEVSDYDDFWADPVYEDTVYLTFE